MILESSTVLIVNANIGSRAILREVLKSFLYKVKITQAQSLREANEYIREGTVFDVAFIAFELGQQEILEFISGLKNEDSIKAPPIIATLKTRGDGSTSEITSLYLEGVAGFISEPYSSDDIAKLWNVLRENKNKPESSNKISKATNLLLNEAIAYVDKMSESQGKKNSGEPHAARSLRRISESLSKLHNQDEEQYAKALIQAFENVKPPKETAGRRTKLVLKEQPHPGIVVRDLMAKRKLSVEGLKETLKIEPEEFKLLLEGKFSVDEGISRELSRVFGKTSKEWLTLQTNYDTYAEQLKDEKKQE